jgi:hypothetical protein
MKLMAKVFVTCLTIIVLLAGSVFLCAVAFSRALVQAGGPLRKATADLWAVSLRNW